MRLMLKNGTPNLHAIVAQKLGLSLKDASEVVALFHDAMSEVLVRRGEIFLPGIGRLTVRDTPARKRYDPDRQVLREEPPGQTIKFKVLPAALRRLSKGRQERPA